MNKNILLIGNYPPPFGGVPVHIKYLAPFLVKCGWNVYILSEGFPKGIYNIDGFIVYKVPKLYRYLNFFSPVLKIREVSKYCNFAFDSTRKFVGFLSFANLVNKIVRDKKIDIISAYHMFAGFAAIPSSKEFSIPLVTTIFGELYSETEFYKKRIREIEEVCRVSRKVLSCSHHCARSFNAINIPFEAETMYYGIDIDRFAPGQDTTRIEEKFGIKKDDRVVLFVGRMNKSMGLHILLESLPQILKKKKDIKFIIAGNEGIYLDAAKVLMRKYKDNVFVSPNVPFDELPLYYGLSTIVVAPSINDRACLGLAIAEGMASEKPVIGCNVGGTREVIIENETGLFVPPENSNALSDCILKLIYDNSTILNMGKNGRERAKSLFDKNEVNMKMEKIFSDVLGK